MSIKPSDTLAGKTQKAIDAIVGSKIAFPRAVGHLESYITNSIACADIVAKNQDAVRAILDWIDTTVVTLAGANTIPPATQRTMMAVLGVLGGLAKVGGGEEVAKVLTTEKHGKGRGRDVGAVVLGVVEVCKGGVGGSPMGEVLVTGLKVLEVVTREGRWRGRRKWGERVGGVVEEVERKGKGGRRGKGAGVGDKERAELVGVLKERFGGLLGL